MIVLVWGQNFVFVWVCANKSGNTSLMEATIKGHTDVAHALLKRPDIDVNIQNKKGFTVLMGAIWLHHVDTVQELLKREDIKVNLHGKVGYKQYKIKNLSSIYVQVFYVFFSGDGNSFLDF